MKIIEINRTRVQQLKKNHMNKYAATNSRNKTTVTSNSSANSSSRHQVKYPA